MKYDKETTEKLVQLFKAGTSMQDIALSLNVPKRSIIAKLSNLGLYQRQPYTTKRGEVPVKKDEYIERIANLMDINIELLDSLDKANKSVLVLIEKALST